MTKASKTCVQVIFRFKKKSPFVGSCYTCTSGPANLIAQFSRGVMACKIKLFYLILDQTEKNQTTLLALVKSTFNLHYNVYFKWQVFTVLKKKNRHKIGMGHFKNKMQIK